MERRGHQFSLPYQNGKAVAAGQDFDFRPGLGDAGSADEDHFQRFAGQGRRYC